MTSLAEHAIVAALHQERLRVARNLHDLVLQDLTAVLLQLRAASHSPCGDSLTGYLGQATSAAEQGLASARRLLRELRCDEPSELHAGSIALQRIRSHRLVGDDGWDRGLGAHRLWSVAGAPDLVDVDFKVEEGT